MKQKPVILFDGICNFCNGAVNFVIKRDKDAAIQFAPLQSEKGRLFFRQYNLPEGSMDSFIFIEDDKVYSQSTAALKVCKYLSGLWPLFYGFIIVPKFIRDGVYNLIAKNRYKWFGVKQECMIPTPEVKARFIG